MGGTHAGVCGLVLRVLQVGVGGGEGAISWGERCRLVCIGLRGVLQLVENKRICLLGGKEDILQVFLPQPVLTWRCIS